jgi:hypothetical protein
MLTLDRRGFLKIACLTPIALRLGSGVAFADNPAATKTATPKEALYYQRLDEKKMTLRTGYSVLEHNMKNGRCKYCGERVAGIWEA